MSDKINDLGLPREFKETISNGTLGLISLKILAKRLDVLNHKKPDKERERVIAIILEAYPGILYDLQKAYEQEAIINLLENKLFTEIEKSNALEYELRALKSQQKFDKMK